MGQIDLHIHSTASDGQLSPEEVVRAAARRGMTHIALADHDTVDGIAAALAAAEGLPGLKVIPGVEISTDISGGELHMLGYFIDYNDPDFQAALDRFRDSRWRRAQQMVARLGEMGMNVSWSRVEALAGTSSIGRPHIAQAMLEGGFIASMKEAFDLYLGHGRPAYVEREKMTPGETVALIIKGGGLPVLAHPLTLPGPEAMVGTLAPLGLAGIEAYYSGYTGEQVGRLLGLAGEYGLVTTGGSDYHGLEASETPIGGVEVPPAVIKQLYARLKRDRGRDA